MLRSLLRKTHCPSLSVLWKRNLPKAFTVSLKPAHVGHWNSCKVVPAVTSCDPAYTEFSVVRRYCNLSESDIKRKVDEITELFSDARELLDDAVRIKMNCRTLCTIWMSFCVSMNYAHVCALSVCILSSEVICGDCILQ